MPTSPDATSTDLFLSLTPHKVIEAVEAAGIPCNRVCYPLNSFENRVYEVEREDRSRVIAKFYRPGRWSRAQILEEHRFLDELAEAEIPVCPALRFPSGETLQHIDHIAYALFPRTGGRVPDELDDALSERLGRLVARIHNVGAAAQAEHRLPLRAEEYARADLDFLEDRRVIPARVEARFLDVAHALTDRAERALDGVEPLRIHGDLHAGNLLLRDGVFHVLDFDDMMRGPAVQDLWLLLPGRDTDTQRRRGLFLDAYEELRRFDRASLRLIEPLRALRMIHYAAWLARRFHDPIFPRTFVHFGTESYWSDQAQDLEEIAELLRAEESGVPARADAPQPSEKYFWDME